MKQKYTFYIDDEWIGRTYIDAKVMNKRLFQKLTPYFNRIRKIQKDPYRQQLIKELQILEYNNRHHHKQGSKIYKEVTESIRLYEELLHKVSKEVDKKTEPIKVELYKAYFNKKELTCWDMNKHNFEQIMEHIFLDYENYEYRHNMPEFELRIF